LLSELLAALAIKHSQSEAVDQRRKLISQYGHMLPFVKECAGYVSIFGQKCIPQKKAAV
jgi:hypothetical protein